MLALILAVVLQEPPKAEEPKREGPDEFLAVTGVRAITVAKGDLESATILIKNGKIAEVGKDVKIPAGAAVVDGRGLVAMPGFVNAYSNFGGSRGFGGGSGSMPHFLAYDEFNPTLDVYESLPRTGFTTFGVYPPMGAISGQGLAMKLNGMPKESMVIARSAFLRVGMRADTSTKDQMKRDFDAAKKWIESEKKYEEEKKKYDEEKKKREDEEKAKKEKKEEKTKEEKSKEEKKEAAPPLQEPKPPQKPDARTQVLVNFLKGELPALVQTVTPGDLAHFWQVTKDWNGMKPRLAFVGSAELHKAGEGLAQRKATVVLRPQVSFLPFTRNRINPAAELHRAGVKVALVPVADSLEGHEAFLFQTAQVVKYGMDRDAAIRSFTIVAAEVLGLEKRLGSLEPGKDGDVVLLNGDPFGSTTKIVRVVVDGKVVFGEERP